MKDERRDCYCGGALTMSISFPIWTKEEEEGSEEFSTIPFMKKFIRR
jgi:hypothetical protein